VSAWVLLGAGLLGGLGSVGRVLLDGTIDARLGRAFPYGVLAVNVTGSFLLGLLVGAGAGGDSLRLAGTGLLGGYTTYSAWILDTDRLGTEGRRDLAVANVLVSLLAGLLAVWLGREL
jgi:CrcB protein